MGVKTNQSHIGRVSMCSEQHIFTGHFVPPNVLGLARSVIVAVFGIHQGSDEINFPSKINIGLIDILYALTQLISHKNGLLDITFLA